MGGIIKNGQRGQDDNEWSYKRNQCHEEEGDGKRHPSPQQFIVKGFCHYQVLTQSFFSVSYPSETAKGSRAIVLALFIATVISR